MSESKKNAATSAFVSSRELVEGIAERIDALGPGTQALIDVLVERLDTLPLAASFDPFAAVSASPAASRRDPSAASAKPKRRPTAGSNPTPQSFGALGQAVAGALGSMTPPPAVMSLSEALAGAPIFKSTGSAGAPAPSSAARRAAGKTPATHAATPEGGLLAVPAQAAERVAQWLTQWVADATAASRPAGSQAAAGRNAIGDAISDQPLFPQQILDALAALGPNPARARRAAPASAAAKTSAASRHEAIQRSSDPARPSTPSPAACEAAPRAGSRLLPAATAPVTPPAGRASSVESDTAPDDPIETMTRALIDQAWLRGVDLR